MAVRRPSKRKRKRKTRSLTRLIVRRVAWGVSGAVCLLLVVMVAYRFLAPPMSALMVWHSFEGNPIDYRWTPMEDISPALARAVIASEDSLFCAHNGVDWAAVSEVVDDIVEDRGKAPRGASTIPMQTIKNLFLWPHRSYIRKAFEVPLAYIASAIWPKRRMLEIYLNIAEWGPGIYGAEAAAQRHFGKSARRLNGGEAALLAAALPNPIIRRVSRPGPLTRATARRILSRMKGIGPYVKCVEKR